MSMDSGDEGWFDPSFMKDFDRKRRRDPRVRAVVPLEADSVLPTPERVRGESVDISASGVQITARQLLAPGSVLELRMILPQGVFRSKAEVVWVKLDEIDPTPRTRMGLTFVGVEDDARAMLDRYLQAA